MTDMRQTHGQTTGISYLYIALQAICACVAPNWVGIHYKMWLELFVKMSVCLSVRFMSDKRPHNGQTLTLMLTLTDSRD